jgi:HNH endonuclease/AP2 domain-containing protein
MGGPSVGKKRRDNTTGHVGVYRDRKYWQAKIVRGGKILWQENFATMEAAVTVRGAKLEALGLPAREAPAAEPPAVPGARWIPLSQGKFALIDEADFPRVSTLNWFLSQGYAKTHDPAKKRQKITLDFFLLNPPEGFEPDHIDRDPLNCRRGNLRAITHAQNMQNRGANRNNTSGYRGVSWHKQAGKWVAQASIGTKHVSLGLFTSAEEAARARDAWIRENHGPFASLNFPEDPPRRP